MPVLCTRTLAPGQRIRVLVVDDSVVIRRLVCHAIEQDPVLEVVGVAGNGLAGLAQTADLNPDVITLDIEMPEMDGLEMLRRLRAGRRDVRVLMFSTLTDRGAAATLEALSLGADDYVTKASNAGSLDVSLANLRHELIPKIRQFFRIPGTVRAVESTAKPQPPAVYSHRSVVEAIGIGISTGGPSALGAILPQFRAGLEVPIFVVQHMPPLFTRFLAERLATVTELEVKEAVSGERPRAGTLYLAPGDFHMRVVRAGGTPEIRLDQAPPESSCRPSVDVLFASLAETYGGAVVAAVMTGMGQDGLRGSRQLKACGARILAQDEASSVVWGMPGAVVNDGIAEAVVPLLEIPQAILRRVGRGSG